VRRQRHLIRANDGVAGAGTDPRACALPSIIGSALMVNDAFLTARDRLASAKQFDEIFGEIGMPRTRSNQQVVVDV
jgi:hypothetical protein